jgi:hypothetical protein
MTEGTKKEPTESELELLSALLNAHQVRTLVANYKEHSLEVDFNVERIRGHGLAASYRRQTTTGPYFITLSPLLLEWELTDRVAFSTIILHELGHIVDRVHNWTDHASIEQTDAEAKEYKADAFVVSWGWGDALVDTLRRSIVLEQEHGATSDLTSKRLARLVG